MDEAQFIKNGKPTETRRAGQSTKVTNTCLENLCAGSPLL